MFDPIDAMEHVKNKACEEAKALKGDLAPLVAEFGPTAKGLIDRGVHEAGEKIGLPNLTIGGATEKLTDAAKSAEHIAKSVDKVVNDGPEAFKNIKNIPMKDWMEMGKAALPMLEKQGPPLLLDGLIIGSTDGMDVVKDVKLGVDVLNLVTSPEAKNFAQKMEQGYLDGEKAKQAKS